MSNKRYGPDGCETIFPDDGRFGRFLRLGDTDDHGAYDFLFTFISNHGSIYRLVFQIY